MQTNSTDIIANPMNHCVLGMTSGDLLALHKHKAAISSKKTTIRNK